MLVLRDQVERVAETEAGRSGSRVGALAAFWIDDEHAPEGLRAALAAQGLALCVEAPGAIAAALFEGCRRAVLCFGPGCDPRQVEAVLDELSRRAPQTACRSLVIAAGAWGPGAFQHLIDDDRLAYLVGGRLPAADLAVLVGATAGTWTAPLPADVAAGEHAPEAGSLRRLALAGSEDELAAGLHAATARTVRARRHACVVFDPERSELRVFRGRRQAETDHSPAVGLVSFVVRTGATLVLPRVGDDPRFDRELDDPGGGPGDRFLAVPVRGHDGAVLAVLVAARAGHEPAFGADESAALEALAGHAAEYTAAWRAGGDEHAAAAGPRSVSPRAPYRRQALRELEVSSTGQEPLRVARGWMRWTTWLACGAPAAALCAGLLLEVPEYASGPAVVRPGTSTVVALVPERYRLQLRPGLRLRVDLPGAPVAGRWLALASIAPEVLSPAEARRVLGARADDALGAERAWVMVTAALPGGALDTRAQAAANLPARMARAEIPLRSERLLFALLPGLGSLWGAGGA